MASKEKKCQRVPSSLVVESSSTVKYSNHRVNHIENKRSKIQQTEKCVCKVVGWGCGLGWEGTWEPWWREEDTDGEIGAGT